MHFGLEFFTIAICYAAFLVAIFLTIFWKPVAGLFYLIPIIPQQTMRYRMDQYPFGANVIILTLIAIAVGLKLRDRPIFDKLPWRGLLLAHIIFLSISACLGSLYLNVPLPFMPSDPRFNEWKAYVIMPWMAFLAAAAVTNLKDLKIALVLICLGILLTDKAAWEAVSGRDYSSYSDELRDPGPMGYAGSNGLGAFLAQSAVFMVAMAAYAPTRSWKLPAYALALFSLICLLFSLSRGGYLAFAVGFLFVSLACQRKLLIMTVLFATSWLAFVPEAVIERVGMTTGETGELDHSSETRVNLWEDAFTLIESNPLTGTGYLTYAYMGRVGDYKDTHNIYIKVLVETGWIGLAMFLTLIFRFIWTGLRLFATSIDPVLAGLGMGLAGWVICSAVANFFGDRWNYFQVNGYMWVLAGLTAKALELLDEMDAQELELESESEDAQSTESEPSEVLA